jgi:hypothetical protein
MVCWSLPELLAGRTLPADHSMGKRAGRASLAVLFRRMPVTSLHLAPRTSGCTPVLIANSWPRSSSGPEILRIQSGRVLHHQRPNQSQVLAKPIAPGPRIPHQWRSDRIPTIRRGDQMDNEVPGSTSDRGRRRRKRSRAKQPREHSQSPGHTTEVPRSQKLEREVTYCLPSRA